MRPLPLYDEAILERAKRPAGAGELAEPRRRGRAVNALCGDEIDVDVRLADGRIGEIGHEARGCALLRASASLLAETLPGHEPDRAYDRRRALRAWLSGLGPLPSELAPLRPVGVFPARARCVLLAWDALASALTPDKELLSTGQV
jgi:nitrogen fixation NifU-like protein